ncbi:hypothetical protein GWD52_02090 [Enterobacteriaceae bacterium 4M9]|nr:hypothetical protein [Enterobacteriaceae bacterium 4M9]
MSDLTMSIITDCVMPKLDSKGNGQDIKIKIIKHMIKKGNFTTTREVADECDLSIYSARRWLMSLERAGIITNHSTTRITRWWLEIK